ncbi:MAG TPA: TetR/AcrR family transcriptional regulator [Gemmatimonadaceae bacterium]|nr:TetR/AcrR family transcriptional regulator [Gemmatimonadaceae bacterium]
MKRNRIVKRSPGRPRSEEAHAAILDAAIALVRAVGYDAVTMDGIAARAGVSKPTIYRRWKSKELVVVEAIGRLVRGIAAPPDTGTTRGDVLALLRVAVAMYADPATGALLSGLVAAMARNRRIARAVRAGFVATWRDAMHAVLERGVARGDLAPRQDLDFATDLLAGPLAYRFLITGAPVDLAVAERVVDVVLRGLAARQPRRS